MLVNEIKGNLDIKPLIFLKSCGITIFLVPGDSGWGKEVLPSGLKGWRGHVMRLEALAGKTCIVATVGPSSYISFIFCFGFVGVDFDFSELTFIDHGL
nr:hypothetical protein [Tanacetum cinerariifolium]